MRVTIFGATGLLGKALMREWQGEDVQGLGSKDADIRSPEQVGTALRTHRPEYVVLAAAYTDVVAHNYNYGCADGQSAYDETMGQGLVVTTSPYTAYCCCYK